MKRFLMTMALTCVLSSSSLAGEVPTVGITSPPPPPSGFQSATDTTAPGDVPSVGFSQQVSEAAFDLIQLLMGTLA